MRYRSMGSLDVFVSALGFGCMSLAVRVAWDDVDEKFATRLLRHARDSGVKYLDTAYEYHGGKSELLVAKTLDGGYRE